MLAIKYLMFALGLGLTALAAAVLSYDFFMLIQYRRLLAKATPESTPPSRPELRWPVAAKLVLAAALLSVMSSGIVVIPAGHAGVRVSQLSGTLPGTLYSGAHFMVPLIQHAAVYDVRERTFNTASSEQSPVRTAAGEKPLPAVATPSMLQVQSREGLPIGLALSVRYRLEASRLDYIHNNLPTEIDQQIVAPVIASVFRDLAPNYTVREMFTTKRDEIRQRATGTIESSLGKEGIMVEEVMLRDVQLPPEYMQGLQGLLMKEQEADRMGVETEIQEKQVRISELQAEQEKVRAVKQAEGEAAVRVLQAKAESDAMQYTLPLKEKQIQQSKLEAEARKESTIENAEADAQAKVIDAKAEQQRRELLADSEAQRIRVVAAADSQRLNLEAAALKQNPLLINKIFAEKLSDKIRIMMVPTDGKFMMGNLMQGMTAGADDSAAPTSDTSSTR